MAQTHSTNGQTVCTHGIRGLDPATGTCIPCRDEQVLCQGCGNAIAVGDWLRYGRRCEPCHDTFQRNLDIAMKFASYEARFWAAKDNADRAVAAELRAQDRGGA